MHPHPYMCLDLESSVAPTKQVKFMVSQTYDYGVADVRFQGYRVTAVMESPSLHVPGS